MTRQIKILLACVCHAFDFVTARVAAIVGAVPRARLIILNYHGVPAIKREKFAWQMDTLMRRARVVTADWNGDGMGGLACAITFDDAFVSVLDNALPELATRKIRCAIFVPAGLMGRAPDWAMEAVNAVGDVVATEEALKALPDDLVIIGAHTVSHPMLTRIPREAARSEVEGARALLTGIFGREVTLLAFPYGDYDEEVVRMCLTAGYDLVYSVEPRPVQVPSSKFVRGRVSADPDDSRLEFFLKMSGSYRWVAAISVLKRSLGLGSPKQWYHQSCVPRGHAAGNLDRNNTVA
jgi:peptidoglycan/xylan/chitin deacetylase (PgdA/CDA1 family)